MNRIFSDAVQIISGGTPKTNIEEYWGGTIKWLSVVDFNNDDKYVSETEKTITKAGVENSSTKILEQNDIIISARGTVGALAMLSSPMAFNQSCFGLRSKVDDINQDFLYYYLKNYINTIKMKTLGSVFDTINLNTFDELEINAPKLATQVKISKTLGILDMKIQNNKKIIAELENMAKTIYDYWFTQFDFPDENGKPYKSSGGAMVYNEELKREIPQGWTIKYAKDLCPVVTGREDANFAVDNGKYPFFTCSQSITKCNNAVFEGSAVLIAGNGDFNVKHYTGEFNAYQRTYVLIPTDKKYYAPLYVVANDLISQFKKNSNGSIVKFITKGDVESIVVFEPNDDTLYTKLNSLIYLKEEKSEENQQLTELRDWLLPMLMNGQAVVE